MKFLLSILHIIFFISVSYSSYAKCNFNCSKEKKTTSLIFEHNSKFNENSLSVPLKEAREKFEKEYLSLQLKKFNGNISKTATFVGMERSALHRKLKGLGIKEFN